MLEGDKTIKLSDGRTLGYREHGDLSGKPIFYIHGNPGSRFFKHPDDSIPNRVKARIIVPDRPGYGISDYQENRKVLDFPNDIAQLADALGIKKFAIFGASAGTPYVLACCYKLGDRITNAAVVSGASPLDRKDCYEGMNETMQKALKAAKLPKFILKIALKKAEKIAKTNPEKALDDIAILFNESDRQKLKNPELRAQLLMSQAEPYRQGVNGRLAESKILISPWGFNLEDIKIPVHLWYWEGDTTVPIQMGKYLESKIPKTIPHFYKGGGHLSIYDGWEEILKTLVQ